MPDQPRPGVKPRSVKVHDDLWRAAQAKAADRGETVSDVIRRALIRYIR
jgi:hypothetical protein